MSDRTRRTAAPIVIALLVGLLALARFADGVRSVAAAGLFAGGMAFGPFVSRDITPWEDGKPAGLMFRQFLHVIRTGEDPDHPGQVLFWPACCSRRPS